MFQPKGATTMENTATVPWEKGIPPRTNARKRSWRELMAMRLYGRIIDEKLPLAAWRQNETPRSVIVYAVFHHATITDPACIC
jgi:hypothetical protein